MDKRYQVFVSSTYSDLKDERQRVFQTLMEMDCIPAGMELFPASDEEQFNFIKRIIDDCDYYLLIVGGRYGSLTSEGVSYTEQEFDYAISKGIKVVAFLHRDPLSLAVSLTDNNSDLAKQLSAFRERAQEGRLVRYWERADELPGLVSLSLTKTIKTYPAVGWVRATSAGSTELLEQINLLRMQNEDLRVRLELIPQNVEYPDIAGLNETIVVSGICDFPTFECDRIWGGKPTWATIFALIAPHLIQSPLESNVKETLAKSLFENASNEGNGAHLDDQVFQTIKIQFKALGLIDLKLADAVTSKMRWTLTLKGEAEMMRLRVVKSADIKT
jgi:hypothetical protein